MPNEFAAVTGITTAITDRGPALVLTIGIGLDPGSPSVPAVAALALVINKQAMDTATGSGFSPAQTPALYLTPGFPAVVATGTAHIQDSVLVMVGAIVRG